MSHAHHHHAPDARHGTFALAVGINLLYVLVELGYGLLAGSLALLADAGHNASDVLSLLLAWGAAWLATRPPTPRHTYGTRKATVLASLASGLLLLLAMGGIAWEAVGRLLRPAPVAGGPIALVAGVGVLLNGLTALLFLRGQRHDLNLRGAFLHMLADAGVSLAVVLGGALILWTGWAWVDPALSLLVVLAVLAGTWGLLRDALHLSLDGVPRGIDAEEVRRFLASQPGVLGVHDLHVWAMSTTETALSAHLDVDAPKGRAFLMRLERELDSRFGIGHCTLQLETPGPEPCAQAGEGGV